MKKLMIIVLSLSSLGSVAMVGCAEKRNEQRQADAERRQAVIRFQGVMDRQRVRKEKERKNHSIDPKVFVAWAQGVNEELARGQQQQQQPDASNAQVDGIVERWEQGFQSDPNYPHVQDMLCVSLQLSSGCSLLDLGAHKQANQMAFNELTANVNFKPRGSKRLRSNPQTLLKKQKEETEMDDETLKLYKALIGKEPVVQN